MSKYLYEVDEILKLNAIGINEWLQSISGIKLSELKVKDLVFHMEEPIRTGNGVYIFKEKDKAIYVGNCVSRNFVERIPTHFDIRHNGWFNSLLINLIKRDLNRKLAEDKTDENLSNAALFAFENLELVLINFPVYNKSSINKLEDYLRITLKPLNGFKNKILPDENTMISDYIKYDSIQSL